MVGAGNSLAQAMIDRLWGVVAFSVIVSIGVAFAYAAMPALIMRAVDPTQTAEANGLNALARSLGTSTASAIIGAVLGQLTIQLGGATYPSEAGIRLTLAIGAVAALFALGRWGPGRVRRGGPGAPNHRRP